MSAGSLAKAISKSGSSYQQDIQDHQYLHLYKGWALKFHSKNIVVILAVMYGKGVALSDTYYSNCMTF
jgi:hypothetical protein